MTTARTFEHRIKFDSGLPIGQSLVRFTLGERSVLALVEIGTRGQVYYFKQPRDEDMYCQWVKVRGDKSLSGNGGGAIVVYPFRNAEFMRKFDGTPIASIEVTP